MRRLSDPGSLGIALTQVRSAPFSTPRPSLIPRVILGFGERLFQGGAAATITRGLTPAPPPKRLP